MSAAGTDAERARGVAAVPRALRDAALTPGQKRLIVHRCIASCAGTNNFATNQQLSTIRQGVEQCVEACVIEAIHRCVTIRATDTEDRIVGRI